MEETTKITNAQMTVHSMENTLKTVTGRFLETLDRKNLPTLDEAAEGIMEAVTGAFSLHNAAASKEEKWAIPKVLFPAQIADIIKALYHVVNVSLTGGFTDEDYDIPAIYQESGDWEGTYSISEWSFKKIIRQVSYTISERGIAEVMAALRITAPHVKVCEDVDLVPVGNGIFNYKTKQLMPFTPEKVFLRKCSVNYRQSPMNPVIYNKDDGSCWDVESWMEDISDDPAVVELLWQITGAVIRPGVKWNRIAMFYSQEGNNGKGTLCQLLENLCGKKNCTNIPMQDFSKDFLLESLIGKYAIIVNENDVDTYLNKAGILKAVITGDTIQINRKFKQPVSYQFRGFMVQCVNGLPKTKDKSNSLYRRMLIVPFKKCFTGAEIYQNRLYQPPGGAGICPVACPEHGLLRTGRACGMQERNGRIPGGQ